LNVGGEFKSPARFPDTVVMSSHGQKRPAEDPLEDSDEQDLFTHTTPTFPPPGAVPGANGCAPQSRALALCTPETSQHSCFAQVDLINQVRMIRSCWAAKLREVRPTANALLALAALHSSLPHILARIIHTFLQPQAQLCLVPLRQLAYSPLSVLNWKVWTSIACCPRRLGHQRRRLPIHWQQVLMYSVLLLRWEE